MANEDLEAILMQDKDFVAHVVAIHPAEKWDLPSLDDIDYSLWNKEIEWKRLALEDLYRFLNGPYIEDNFKDNGQRKEWRDGMEAKHDWFYGYYRNNALRTNLMGQVMRSAMNQLMEHYTGAGKKELEALAQAARQRAMEASSGYDSKSIKDKIDTSRWVKDAVYQVIMFLYNQGPGTAKEAPR